MLFNPVREWPRKGPFCSLFLTYICLRTIPWYTKVCLPLTSHGCDPCLLWAEHTLPADLTTPLGDLPKRKLLCTELPPQ